jgi:hypothetical protein
MAVPVATVALAVVGAWLRGELGGTRGHFGTATGRRVRFSSVGIRAASLCVCAAVLGSALPLETRSSNPEVTVVIDVDAARRPISPLIYGVNWASVRQLVELNAPLNRQGGNSRSRYNWQLNASNRGRDWYFQSSGERDATPGEFGDTFIRESRDGGAEPMLTIPLLDWVAKLGPGRSRLASYSIAKYGPQTGADEQWFPDAGNGIRPDGSFIIDNDPTDANVRVDVGFQRGWVQHLVAKWGRAAAGGLRYYILDNEPSIWHSTHRDVRPVGATMDEMRRRIVEYASMVKDLDPGALVLAPEEWGWTGYFRSGFDQQWGAKHGWRDPLPDRASNGDRPYIPWLLDQVRQEHERTGRRLLDVLSVHFYPQGGESSDDVSAGKQLLRARSTRSLWDARYRDESWIDDHVRLIPRLREWVESNYPGTAIGITEYDWGAEHHISGAIAQADVLGIFGREGVDLATRWEAPAEGSPVFNAFKLYRNYDGNRSTFGSISVSATVPDPDTVAAFAAERTTDGALTVTVLAKRLDGDSAVAIELRNYPARRAVQRWQLTAANAITPLPPIEFERGRVTTLLPAQSITLFVFGRE